MTRSEGLKTMMVALLLAGLGGCSAGGNHSGGAEAYGDSGGSSGLLLGPSDVASVTRADLSSGLPVSGSLEPGVDIRITAPMPELLDEVLVKEGQPVREGQVLARFRTTALEPAAASAEAERRIAASDLERMKNLLEQGAVSPRDLERAEAALKAAGAAAASSSKRLEEATVRAPVSGVIAQRVVQSGDRVGDGDPLFRLVNTAVLEFEATVPSEFAGRVRSGSRVVLTVSGLGGAAVEGEVSRVNATADPATRQVRVYVTVPNRDGRLVGDLFASGRILLESAPGAIAIPAAGLRVEGAESFAWIVEGGRLERRAVQPGVRDERKGLVEIREGLEAGQTVVIGPIEGLEAGQPVEVSDGRR